MSDEWTTPEWTTPDWKDGTLEDNLELIRSYVESLLAKDIGWYRARIRSVRSWSRRLRVVAILLTSLGGLVPLLEAAGIFSSAVMPNAESGSGFRPGQIGYVLLGVAGSVALFDRFFGYSTAWMRYIATMLALERLRESFRLEWALASRRLASGGRNDAVNKLLQLASRTILAAKEHSEKETEAWIAEFEANLSRLEQDLRAKAEANQPGAVDVRVNDASAAPDGFDLWIDGMKVDHSTASTASIAPVTPGMHKVTVTATVDQKDYAASRMVDVTAGSVQELEVVLGVPAQE